MISYRYHLVTVVAVFLALGLGVLAGTTVIDQTLVDGLRSQIEDANAKTADLKDQVDRNASQLDRQAALLGDLVPLQESGKLQGQEVVVVASEGTDPAVVAQARASLAAAGATVVAGFAATPKMLAPASSKELAQILGVDPSRTPTELAGDSAAAVAERLAVGAPAGADVLLDLLSHGFLVPTGKEDIGKADLPGIGGSGQQVLVLGGDVSDPLVRAFTTHLPGDLVADGASVAAAESSDPTDELVSALRANSNLDGKIVTVDNLDEPTGGLALVLALRHLADTAEGGNYGFKRGASSAYPPLEG